MQRHVAVHYGFSVHDVRPRTAHARTLTLPLAPGQLFLDHHAFGRDLVLAAEAESTQHGQWWALAARLVPPRIRECSASASLGFA